MNNKNDQEELLSGGNVSNVYRIGDTVRRDVKPGSERIHRLLQHLESKGFEQAPKCLGIDEQNREVLSFIEGEAGNYPLKPYMWSDDSLKGIAKMLRGYHDAVSDFPIEEGWQPIDNTPEPMEVICHNDFAVYNIIFNKEKPVGFIDFDMAAPGPRLWDIAYALYTCVPLSRLHHNEAGEAVYYDAGRDADRKKDRVRVFFAAYGVKGMEEGFLEMVLLRVEGLVKIMHRKAQEGDQAFQRMIEERHDQHYLKDLQFIREHRGDWV